MPDAIKRVRREFPNLAAVVAAAARFAVRLAVVLACVATTAPTPAHAEKRVALVIGNGAYRHAPHCILCRRREAT
jgi:hypothetical protein